MVDKEYMPQICIDTKDPVNSVLNVGGTVIGILFEKSGCDISKAINNRVELIDKKIEQYLLIFNKIELFIKNKNKESEEISVSLQERRDKKKAILLPIQEKIAEIVKNANTQLYKFDKESFIMIKKEALAFMTDFYQVKAIFKDLDNLLLLEKKIIKKSHSYGNSGSQGPRGDKGSEGYVKPGVFVGQKISMDDMESDHGLKMHTDMETEAYAKLDTLQNTLSDYTDKLETLKYGINKLREEERRLKLISNNINDTRDYKLNLNMLSAFGFDDYE